MDDDFGVILIIASLVLLFVLFGTSLILEEETNKKCATLCEEGDMTYLYSTWLSTEDTCYCSNQGDLVIKSLETPSQIIPQESQK